MEKLGIRQIKQPPPAQEDEWAAAVNVQIEYAVGPGREEMVAQLLRAMRAQAWGRSGYLLGVTLRAAEGPPKLLASEWWESIEHWKAFEREAASQALLEQIFRLQTEARSVRLYLRRENGKPRSRNSAGVLQGTADRDLLGR